MEKYIILGHKNPDVDSIVSGYLLEKLLKYNGYDASFVIPDDKISDETYKICFKFNLNPYKFMRKLNDQDNKFILIDHSNRVGINNIVAVIDHHPNLGNYYLNIKYYLNTMSSSTAYVIANLPVTNNFDKHDYELVVLATMVDTASFHSTKSVDSEHDWIKDICYKFKIDYNMFYNEGLCLTDISDLNKAMLNGLKEYCYNDIKIESSFIHIDSFKKSLNIIIKMIDSLKKYRINNNLEHFVFIVHDMTLFKTRAYDITKNDISCTEYPRYTSRGDKIIPDIFEKIKLEK